MRPSRDRDRPTQRFDAVGDTLGPGTADHDAQPVVIALDRDVDDRRVGVRQRLGDDVVGGELHVRVEALVGRSRQPHGDGGAARERAQRGAQPAFGENPRVQAAREFPQVVEQARDAVDGARDPHTELRRRVLLHEPQLHRERDEPLLRTVVKVPFEAPAGLVGRHDDPLTRGRERGRATAATATSALNACKSTRHAVRERISRAHERAPGDAVDDDRGADRARVTAACAPAGQTRSGSAVPSRTSHVTSSPSASAGLLDDGREDRLRRVTARQQRKAQQRAVWVSHFTDRSRLVRIA